MNPPRESLEVLWPCHHLGFSPMELILDFWPPKLRGNIFLLFKPQSLLTGYSSPRKQIQGVRDSCETLA